MIIEQMYKFVNNSAILSLKIIINVIFTSFTKNFQISIKLLLFNHFFFFFFFFYICFNLLDRNK